MFVPATHQTSCIKLSRPNESIGKGFPEPCNDTGGRVRVLFFFFLGGGGCESRVH